MEEGVLKRGELVWRVEGSVCFSFLVKDAHFVHLWTREGGEGDLGGAGGVGSTHDISRATLITC